VEKLRANVKDATDEQLMQAVAGGDLDAFNELILRYQSLAWKAAYRFLGDPTEAEDVAQETFLKILQAAPRYRPTAAFRTYVYSVLHHLCIDRSRKKRPASIGETPEIADSSPDPAQSAIAKERQAQIRKALDTLPAKQKAAIILRHYQGLSYAEIAQVLETSPKAVEGLIGRARATLQIRLSFLKNN
jgi:RNA polymerase sigma-70 factor (ECF subfamily)